MSPIGARAVVENVIPKIIDGSSERPDSQALAKLIRHISTAEKKYGNYLSFDSRSVHSIDFAEQ